MQNSKEQFIERVAALRVNVDAIKSVTVTGPDIMIDIPHSPGKLNSLQIFAAITTNNSFIGPDEAKRGLEIFGEDLCLEAKKHPGMHPSIDVLENILQKGLKARSVISRNPLAKTIPQRVVDALQTKSTPFHLYDEQGIRETARRMNKAFGILNGYRNYFAVKALPNPHIIEILKEEGMGVDCSSLPELHIAESIGFSGSHIMLTSNNTQEGVLKEAVRLGAIINLDDITFIDFLEKTLHGKLPDSLCFRYNPGAAKKGNSIIGDPSDAKYGLVKDQLFEAYRRAEAKGVKKFGLHTMVASNELNPEYFIETAKIMFELAAEIKKIIGIEIEFINLGGGIGIPYKPEQLSVDLDIVAKGIKELYDKILVNAGLSPNIYTECGRCVTGPHGYLAAKIRHVMHKHKKYLGIDAPNAALDRAGRYGAYHHITVIGKENEPTAELYDVVSGLCENVKFAVNRPLPVADQGDLVVIHDTGAHGLAMKNNYNAELAPAEYLLRESGEMMLIRRAETEDDYFKTIVDYPMKY